MSKTVRIDQETHDQIVTHGEPTDPFWIRLRKALDMEVPEDLSMRELDAQYRRENKDDPQS